LSVAYVVGCATYGPRYTGPDIRALFFFHATHGPKKRRHTGLFFNWK
jgi:hypothetical protein